MACSRSIPLLVLFAAATFADQFVFIDQTLDWTKADTASFALSLFGPAKSGVFAVADIDGDGANDIVGTNWTTSAIAWYRYPGFAPATIALTGTYGMEIHAADVDGDGDMDVLAPEPDAKTVWWWKNPGAGGGTAGSAWEKVKVGTWPGGYSHDFKIGDLNGDGRADAVLTVNETGKPWHIYVQRTPGQWDHAEVGRSDFEGTWVADIDGDGDDDITCGKYWFEAPADPIGGAWQEHTINAYPWAKRRTVVADINADGNPDVVTTTAEFGAGPLAWYEAPDDPREENWTAHELMPKADYNHHTCQVGDVNLDGRLDIVVGSTHYLGNVQGYWIRIFYNTLVDDRIEWVEQSWQTKMGSWQGVLADVGSDGDLDLVSANYDKAQQELWENLLGDGGTLVRPIRAALSPPPATKRPGSIVDIRGRRVTAGTEGLSLARPLTTILRLGKDHK